MPEVTLYSGPYCPYCNMAKALLKQLGVTEIREIRADSEPEAFEAMRRATNTRTVPQIFIGDTHVGGFTDLRALHNAGRLTELLQKKLKLSSFQKTKVFIQQTLWFLRL